MDEIKSTTPATDSSKAKGLDACSGNCHHHHPMWRLAKFLIALLVILLVLVCGIEIGRHSAGYGKMVSFRANGRAGGPGMPGNQVYGFGGAGAAGMRMMGTRIAGQIVSVSGTKITLTDNGGAQQVVVTDSKTVITSATGSQIAVSSLTPKQFITASVTVTNGQNVATRIQVAQ